MKAITMRIQKFSRPGVILLATVVAIITSVVVANATQTITTPNAVKITYNLAAGANSATITPVTNTSVLVMGCCTTIGGAGQVTLLARPSGAGITWVGLEAGVPSAITAGDSFGAGNHIVFLDVSQSVEIQTASADTMLIHNGSTGTRAGNVTLIW
jgi:hypothetical protein